MRSIVRPGGLWEEVPAGIDQADAGASNAIASWGESHPQAMRAIRTMTEGSVSIATSLILVWVLCFAVILKKRDWRTYALHLAMVLVSLGLLDLFTNRVMKASAGRLKPWFKFFDPNAPYQLSFPSSHAAASFFMLTYLWILTKKSQSKWKNVYRALIVVLFTGVAFSRVLVRQHYLLDVSIGALIGALAAIVVMKIYTRLWARQSH